MIVERFCFSFPEWSGLLSRRNSTSHQQTRFRRRFTRLGMSVHEHFKPLGGCVLLAVLAANLLMLPTASAQEEIEDWGNFDLIIMPAAGSNDAIASVADLLAGRGMSGLESVVEELNMNFNLRQPVSIVFSTWPEIDIWAEADLAGRAPGALFDRNGTDDIYLSYEFMVKMLELLDGDENAWYTNVINVVLHEVGHALIHINDIAAPQGGADPERDADEVAFFIFSTFYGTENKLDQVAEIFWRNADEAYYEDNDHIPDRDRAERFECWIDGSFEGGSWDCERQFSELMDAWDEYLAPSWKDPFGGI